jgi:16S rRNA (cytidine1402-2'-O)-methyltransferase
MLREMGTLYVVTTPIGNLEDITLRALRVLGEVSLIAAEDTRTTRKLLTRYHLHVPLVSYNEHNSAGRTPRILEALAGGDVALVSDAGAPGVSDPGSSLVRDAAEHGHTVTPVPGPSSVTTAVSAAGLPGDAFCFLGFLPRTKKARRALLNSAATLPWTLVAFETPHRLRASLEDILASLGDRPMTVCRELTKLHEELYRGVISDALEHFQTPRGEFVLVIEGASSIRGGALETPITEPIDDNALREQLTTLKAQGVTARDAAAQLGTPRGVVYKLWRDIN